MDQAGREVGLVDLKGNLFPDGLGLRVLRDMGAGAGANEGFCCRGGRRWWLRRG